MPGSRPPLIWIVLQQPDPDPDLDLDLDPDLDPVLDPDKPDEESEH